jgi:hypothetical protein
MFDFSPKRLWMRLRGKSSQGLLFGKKHRVVKRLYSQDGKRSVEIMKFRWGKTYLLESEWVDGNSFAPRHDGRPVGPFDSPLAAERFIVATEWFNGGAQAAS